MIEYYNPTKLLSLKDLDGKEPEIYICDGNRSTGKTTAFNKLVFNRFVKRGEKFCLLFRYKYEIQNDIAEKFFCDIQKLWFNDYELSYDVKLKGSYGVLTAKQGNKKDVCGYTIAINSADLLKKNSNLLSGVSNILFDEFQSETNSYCTIEVEKFHSIHKSLSRGINTPVKRLPVFMVSNSTSLLNPYYTAFDISARLQADTKFLRGNGWVLEHNLNTQIADLQNESGVNRALSKTRYFDYLTSNNYLLNNGQFVGKIKTGKKRYICGVRFEGHVFGIYEIFTETDRLYYVSVNADLKKGVILSASLTDHDVGGYYNGSINLVPMFRVLFNDGVFRFENLDCKRAFYTLISY